MVLGLIDFLLGGKKKTKVPRNAQVANPVTNNVEGMKKQEDNSVPDGVTNATSNSEDKSGVSSQSQNQSEEKSATTSEANAPQSSGRKSISDVINKIHNEIKSTNESVVNLVSEIKEVQNSVNSIDNRVGELENSQKSFDEKVGEIDDNMGKFLSLYELVNNQYNPFIDQEGTKQVVVSSQGDSLDEGNSLGNDTDSKDKVKEIDLKQQFARAPVSSSIKKEDDELEHTLLELDTLSIQKAAGEAVPLTKIKSNTNSLVTILSWLEYLVKKVGVEETKTSLRYYTETLKWITPEVYFELDKFLRGMGDLDAMGEKKSLNVKDHIVSLYFISKLNEKPLDKKLTKAVLQIIKE